MCLPTRSRLAKAMWGLLAIGILAATSLALSFGGENPLFLATGGAETLLGYVAAISDVSTLVIAFVAPFVLVALGIGFLVDLVIAGLVFSAVRRRGMRPAERIRGA
ncbi:MAG: hypothetical protein ACR2KW_08620 [Rubrobacter sp.]